MKKIISNYFMFEELGTSFKTEIIAGVTTFMTMAYILATNPNILYAGGYAIPHWGAIFTATALTAALGTLIMGVFAKYPLGVASGMGLNAFFANTIVIGMGIDWQIALAGTFISGILFCILSITGAREKFIYAIPKDLKAAIGAGIGLFIAFIGLRTSGLVIHAGSNNLTLGNLSDPDVLLTLIGIIIMVILLVRKVTGAIFISMIIVTTIGIVIPFFNVLAPDAIFSMPYSLTPTFGQAVINLPNIFTLEMIIVIFIMFFVDFIDTAGIVVAAAEKSGLVKEDGEIPRAGNVLLADASSTVVGSVLGTTTTASYVESFAGISVGGKSGFTAVVIAFFFFIALFLSPLFSIMTSAITAPALIIVGILMASQLKDIEWDNFEVAVPAFFIVIMMPFSGSIATGIGFGFLLYPLVKIVTRKAKEVHPVMYAMAPMFILYFVLRFAGVIG